MIRGDRLRFRRLQMRLSQEEIAQRANTDQKRISVYETGKSDATGETVASLARVLEVSADWLLGLTDDPIPCNNAELDATERRAILAWRRGDKTEAVKIIVNG
jgi:transcriptional regulator with XRE-family HTH domain